MRKLFALILVLTMLPLIPVFAENTAPAEPSVTLSPEEWVKQHVDENTPLSIEVVPYDELPPVVEGQHHYLLLCIDQWVRDARPDGIGVPKYATGGRKDIAEFAGKSAAVVMVRSGRLLIIHKKRTPLCVNKYQSCCGHATGSILSNLKLLGKHGST